MEQIYPVFEEREKERMQAVVRAFLNLNECRAYVEDEEVRLA